VCPTNASLYDLIGTPIKAALFLLHLGAVSDTYSSLLGMISTSRVAASFHLRSMGDTNSSLVGSIGTTLKAARLPLCTMRDTNSPLVCSIITSLEATPFHLCSMGDAYSSLLCIVGTSLMTASPLSNLCFDTWLRFFGNRLFLQSLHLLFTLKD
jgi:hypothetical protein